ncbi:MAG: S53 family peptidase [Ktedonobacteraceae bacterium]
MKRPDLKNRLTTGAAGITLMLGMACSALLTGGTVSAATLPHSHGMSVHPIYQYAGQSTGKTFKCQQPGAAINCYTAQELLNAYNIQRVHDAGIKGEGQTIVIIDAYGDPTVANDLNVFDTTFGFPAAKLNVVNPFGATFDATDPVQSGWSGEIALDVESSHAVAPEATIDLVLAKTSSDQDIQNALAYAVDHRLGNVISQSYGEAESCMDPTVMKAQHRTFAKAVREGISLFASAGDNGAAQGSCDGNSFIQAASSPASDPYVTSVGATSLTASQPNGTYSSETAWNDQYGASGGGYSSVYHRPFYQNGFVQNSHRGVPDVSYSGDVNNGLLIAWSQGNPSLVGSIYIFGGTSAGSPQWAAMTSLVDSVFGPQGDLNPLLYQFVARFEYHRVFHDVTVGNNTVTETDANGNPVNISGFNAGRGWDAVTGLGSIDLGNAILGSGSNSWSKSAIAD